MKKFLKFTLTILIVSLLATAFYYLPYKQIQNSIPIVNKKLNKTALSITSKNSVATVNIDGRDYGSTPLSIPGLSRGRHNITITKISNNTDFYKPFETVVTLEKGTEAEINVEIGPKGTVAGVVLYYVKAPTQNESYLSLISQVKDVTLLINNTPKAFSDDTGLLHLQAGEYNVTIAKDGYENLSFPIVIRKGLNLYLHVYLFPKPISIKKI